MGVQESEEKSRLSFPEWFIVLKNSLWTVFFIGDRVPPSSQERTPRKIPLYMGMKATVKQSHFPRLFQTCSQAAARSVSSASYLSRKNKVKYNQVTQQSSNPWCPHWFSMESRQWWIVTVQCPQVGFLVLRCRTYLNKSRSTRNCPL